MSPSAAQPHITVVIPVHDEEDNVEPLHRDLFAVLDAAGRPFEILFVDDGSTDGTLEELESLARTDPHLRILELDGNFGEAAALSAGFHHARGDIVVTLDGDGQNDPADIPRVLDLLETSGARVVSGRREDRQEDYWLRVLPSRIANSLIVRITGVPIYDCGCGLKAYRKEALGNVQLPRGMNRFLPAILGVRPADVAELSVRDRPREHGRSHYGIGRAIVVLRDLLALPFLIRDPRGARMNFALATGGLAVLGAVAQSTSILAAVLFDTAAVAAGLIWWNARRFHQAQIEGVYQVRRDFTGP